MGKSYEGEVAPEAATPTLPAVENDHRGNLDKLKELLHIKSNEAAVAQAPPGLDSIAPANTLETVHRIPPPPATFAKGPVEPAPWEEKREPVDMKEALEKRQAAMASANAQARKELPLLKKINIRMAEAWSKVSQFPKILRNTLIKAISMGGH